MKIVAILLLLCANAYAIDPLSESDMRKQDGNSPFTIRSGAQASKSQCAQASNPAFLDQSTRQRSKQHSEVQLRSIMDRRNGHFQALYQKDLHENPCLSGGIRFHIEVAPSGLPTKISFIAENQGMAVLAEKLVPLITVINFGAAEQDDSFDYVINFFAS